MMAKDKISVDQAPAEAIAPAITANAAVKAIKAGRAKDVDIAAQIVAEYSDENQSWSAEEEKRLMRRVDWRLIPIVRSTGTYPQAPH
jgi:MFS transporter, ACS family, allantoate permease